MTDTGTKIVATLGPASDGTEDIRALAEAGMSVARLNASHGTTDHRRRVIDRVRAVNEDLETPVATMLDVPGPEIRTAPLEEPLTLAEEDELRLVHGDEVDREDRVVGVSASLATVGPGDRILIDDGLIETTVDRVEGDVAVVTVDSGGTLGGRRSVNAPGVDLDLETVSERDREELQLAAEADVSYVAASFVGGADDVDAIVGALESFDADVPVVAKIERADAVERLDEILVAADGVMVARGDLGVECPLEQVPLIQKRIIRRARGAGIPVITATEMLDSMVDAPRPTRAEASDVANAVLDGTDAVMLSAETAVGDHPVRTVETMHRIVADVEASEEYAESREQRVPPVGDTRTDALARSARYLARDVDAAAVVTVTESGYTARKVAKYRPAEPVVVVTPERRVSERLALVWGVRPRHRPRTWDDASELIDGAVEASMAAEDVESGDTVVVLTGMMSDLTGTDTANTLKVHVAAEVIASGQAVVDGRTAGPVYPTVDGDLSTCPDGVVVRLLDGFDGEFTGDLGAVAGIVTEKRGLTNYAAMVARELGVPMVGGVSLDVPEGTVVTVDGERGVVYEGDVDDQ